MAEAAWIKGPNNLEITVAAGATWACADYFPKGIVLHSITIKGTANDVLVMRSKGTSTTLNPRICHFGDATGLGAKMTFTSAHVSGDKIYRFPTLCVAECTIGATNFAVLIEYEE